MNFVSSGGCYLLGGRQFSILQTESKMTNEQDNTGFSSTLYIFIKLRGTCLGICFTHRFNGKHF